MAWLALGATSAAATLLYVEDFDGEFRRLGIGVRAEAVTHRGERLLLLRFEAQAPAAPSAIVPMAFAPVEIACDRVTVHSEGRTRNAHADSPCALTGRLGQVKAVPVFVAFAWPPLAREARLTVPVEVLAPLPGVQTSLRGASPSIAAVPTAGKRTLVARIDLGPAQGSR